MIHASDIGSATPTSPEDDLYIELGIARCAHIIQSAQFSSALLPSCPRAGVLGASGTNDVSGASKIYPPVFGS